MSWQDELRQLDSALASGQISADEYRTRRDGVIAQASGQQTPEPQQSAGAEPTHVFRPVQPPQPGPDSGDRTQIVPGVRPPVGDRTQVVSQDNSADSTQIVPGATTGGGQPQFPPLQPPPPWETAHPPAAPHLSPPPWANDDLPPEFGQQNWPRQGPEIFEEKSSGKTGKIVAIIVAVVLVLGGGGAAVWFFALKDDGNDPQAGGGDNNTSQTQSTEDDPSPPPPELPEGPFIELSGEEILNRDIPMEQALTDKHPTEPEAQLLESVGVAQIGALVHEEDGIRTGIWAFQMGPDGDPKVALTAMDELYQQALYELVSDQDGILVRMRPASSPEEPTVYRAHFVVDGGYMVRVEVYGVDAEAVESIFTELLDEETAKYPAIP